MTPLLDNHLAGRWQAGSGAGTALFDPVLGTELVRVSGAGLDLAEGYAFARRHGAHAILRGVRSYQDWEYELRMLQMNRHLAPELETVFLAPAVEWAYVSSTLVREVAALGGDLTDLVPPAVAAALARRRPPGAR